MKTEDKEGGDDIIRERKEGRVRTLCLGFKPFEAGVLSLDNFRNVFDLY